MPATGHLADSLDSQARFVDITREVGIDFFVLNGEESGHYSILETLGAGIAWLDIQNDGLLDLFIPGGGKFDTGPVVAGLPGQLFVGRETRYQAMGHLARLADDTLYSHAAVVGDYDNDGFCDLLVTGYGGLRLFHNCGDGTFYEAAERVGLDLNRWSTGAAWGDFSGDGNLDLYIVNYLDWSFENHPECFLGERSVCAPTQFSGIPDSLFLSDGAGGFLPASLPPATAGKGLAALAADLDLDGDLDLYVANDTTPNLLLQNTGAGSFVEVGIESGTAFGEGASSDGSMGIDVGDFNSDGLPDIWVANFEGQSFGLYQNIGNLIYEHVSAKTGISAVGGVYVGFGTAFFDFDCDGDEDIISVNGHVTPASTNSPFRQQPLLFENIDGRRLVNVARQAGDYMNSAHMARGLGLADIDDDGDLDVAITHTNEAATLLRNESTADHHWLSMRLIGRQSSRNPIGASVVLHSESTGEQLRLYKSGTSYLSSHDERLFFGLGNSSEPVSAEIRWPSGQVQMISQITPDQHLTILEPETAAAGERRAGK